MAPNVISQTQDYERNNPKQDESKLFFGKTKTARVVSKPASKPAIKRDRIQVRAHTRSQKKQQKPVPKKNGMLNNVVRSTTEHDQMFEESRKLAFSLHIEEMLKLSRGY